MLATCLVTLSVVCQRGRFSADRRGLVTYGKSTFFFHDNQASPARSGH